MKVLLDTHIILWTIVGDKRLSRRARQIIENPKNTIFYSHISLWEVTLKRRSHPKSFSHSAKEVLYFCKASDFVPLALKESHILQYEDLPKIHLDPFDNILVSQAKAEKMTFLTHDEILLGYGSEVVLV